MLTAQTITKEKSKFIIVKVKIAQDYSLKPKVMKNIIRYVSYRLPFCLSFLDTTMITIKQMQQKITKLTMQIHLLIECKNSNSNNTTTTNNNNNSNNIQSILLSKITMITEKVKKISKQRNKRNCEAIYVIIIFVYKIITSAVTAVTSRCIAYHLIDYLHLNKRRYLQVVVMASIQLGQVQNQRTKETKAVRTVIVIIKHIEEISL